MVELFTAQGTFNDKVLNYYLETYFFSTGVPVFVIDEKGHKIKTFGDEMSFCSFFKTTLGQSCPCSQTHLYASRQAANLGDVYVFFCPAGLVHYTAPILKNKLFKGAIVAGPVLMNYPDDLMVDEIIQKYNLSLDLKGKIFNYLKSIVVIGPEKVRHLANMLFMLTANLMPEETDLLNVRKTKNEQQSRISESIHFEKEKDHISTYYPYEKEKDLLGKVKNGDAAGARAILNELLGHVFLTTGGNVEIIKARILELCALLSRAAVEGGASLEKIFGMNFKFISALSKIQNIEDLAFWTLKVLDRFTDNVFDLSQSKHAEIIKKALTYINDNYYKPISLESVSKVIHLNPTYFSTVFNKEMGMGFSDYLNKVRIEESKKMLKNRNNTILDVAVSVGFENHSYFSKVFKKNTGISPKVFRDSLNTK